MSTQQQVVGSSSFNIFPLSPPPKRATWSVKPGQIVRFSDGKMEPPAFHVKHHATWRRANHCCLILEATEHNARVRHQNGIEYTMNFIGQRYSVVKSSELEQLKQRYPALFL